MRKNKINYFKPEIEIISIITEQCLAASLGGIDPNPTNPGENPTLPDTDDEW